MMSALLFVLPMFAAAQVWDGYNGTAKNGQHVPPLVENPLGEQQTGYFLLRTGFLMQGTATSDGKHYALKTNFGTMRIPVGNVEFVGKTPQEVYEYKSGPVQQENCSALMRFGEWCFRNGLKDEGIALLRRAKGFAEDDGQREAIELRLNTEQSEVVPAASALQDDEGNAKHAVSVPKSVADLFAQKVQPVLVSRCAAADCHGSKSTHPFKLSIPQQTRGATTNRNLQAVLPWIDLDYPPESKLLAALVSYHGGGKAALNVESPQYNSVVQWIQTAAKELPVEQRSGRVPNGALRNAEPVAVKTDLLPQGFQDIKPPDTRSAAVYHRAAAVQMPSDNKEIDPFDPEVFNQRHHRIADPRWRVVK